MTRPALVKVGGSVLTDKSTLKTPDADAIEDVAAEVAGLDEPLVLVHGAGSYGHVRSDRWNLAQGDAEATPRQAARVRADILALHGRLVDALARQGLAPASLPPFGLARAVGGTLEELDPEPFRVALDRGFLPVTYGDVVPDTEQGFAPVSGDALLASLAEPLDARLAVFATDVPGILRDGEVVRRVAPDEARGLGGEAGEADVTGGMAAKARHAADLAAEGTPVRVVDGATRGNLQAALEGKAPGGTLVTQEGSL